MESSRNEALSRKNFRIAKAIALLVVGIAFLTGCGGGGDKGGGGGGGADGDENTKTAKLTVSWAARSRGKVDAPSSALSVRVTYAGGDRNGTDVIATYNRGAQAGAFQQSYESPTEVRTGYRNVSVRFFAGTDASGTEVARADAGVNIDASGNVQEDITNIEQSVKGVEVLVNQTVTVGSATEIQYAAKEGNGNIVAVSPGSAFFTVPSGGEKLSVEGGTLMRGLSAGQASLQARIDNVASEVTPVLVKAPVAPMKALLVADDFDPKLATEVVTTREILQRNNIPVTVVKSLEGVDTSGYDAVILHEAGQITSATAPLIVNLLAQGKGVVVLGNAAAKLVDRSLDDRVHEVDTTPIAPWFGGVTLITNFWWWSDPPFYTQSNIGEIPFLLPIGISGGAFIYDLAGSDNARVVSTFKDRIGTNTAPVVLNRERSEDAEKIAAFAYETSSGGAGRVYYQWHPYGLNTATNERVDDLFILGLLWSARR